MDIATLGLRVDGTSGIQQIKQFGDASEKTGRQTDQLTASVKKQDETLRRIAESGQAVGDTQRRIYDSIIRANGGWERYGQIQRQVTEEMKRADALVLKLAEDQANLGNKSDGAHLAFGRLRGGVQSLVTTITGFNPVVAQAAGVMGSFAVGTTLTVGVLLGLAAIAKAYDLLTEKTRELAKETDAAIDRLRRLKQEQQGATAGIDTDLQLVDARLADARNKLKIANQFTGGQDNPSGDPGYGPTPEQIAAAKKTIDDLNADIRAGEIERTRIINEGAARTQQALISDLSNLIKHNTASAAQVEQAKLLYRGLQDAIKHVDPNNTSALSVLTDQLDTLDKALNPVIKHLKELKEASKLPTEPVVRITPASGAEGAARSGSVLAASYVFPDSYDRHGNLKPIVESEAQKRAEAGFVQKTTDAAAAIKEHATALQKATQVISQTVEYYLVQKLGGGSFGGNLGASLGKSEFQDLQGSFGKSAFINSAVGSAIVAPIFAGLGAAVGNAVDGLFDISGAAKAFREEIEKLKKSTEESIAIERVKASGGDPSQIQQETSVHQAFSDYRDAAKKILDADTTPKELIYRIKDAELQKRLLAENAKAQADYNASLEEYAKLEREQIELIAKHIAEAKKEYDEDLKVRLLRATGHDKEADSLAFDNEQKRERDKLIESFGAEIDAQEAATLALLDQVQTAERLKQSVDALTTTMSNAPSGYKVDEYTYRFGIPRTYTPNSFPINIPYTPGNPGGGTTANRPPLNVNTLNISLPNVVKPEQVGPALIKYLDQVGAKTLGINATRADVLEVAGD